MASGAKLTGLDDVLEKLEEKLGERKVKQIVNDSLRAAGQEIEPEFRSVISSYRDTGRTVNEITVSRVVRVDGIPKIKIGFRGGVKQARWRLVHLQEFGYDGNGSPRGLGKIRNFSSKLEGTYPDIIARELRERFGL